MSNNHFEINNMDRLNIGDHSVLLYEHEKDTILPLVSFIKSSLKRGEKCLYIKGDTNTELLKNKLENEVENFKKYINTKQLQFLTKEETYSLSDNFKADRMINKIKRISSEAKNEGYTGLSITGELSWVLNFENGDKELIKLTLNSGLGAKNAQGFGMVIPADKDNYTTQSSEEENIALR